MTPPPDFSSLCADQHTAGPGRCADCGERGAAWVTEPATKNSSVPPSQGHKASGEASQSRRPSPMPAVTGRCIRTRRRDVLADHCEQCRRRSELDLRHL